MCWLLRIVRHAKDESTKRVLGVFSGSNEGSGAWLLFPRDHNLAWYDFQLGAHAITSK